MAEHQVGQTRPAVPPRQLWDQPEHFRGTNKNRLGLERGEQSRVEELMASHPFSGVTTRAWCPGRVADWPAFPCDAVTALPHPVPQFPHPNPGCNDTDPCMKRWEITW